MEYLGGYSYLSAAGFGVLTILLARWFLSLNRYPLPPGPPSIPIIGNIHHMPRGGNLSIGFWELSKKYGPLIHFEALGTHIVVINSWKACVDLLGSSGPNFADRPKFPMFELMGWDFNLALLPYGDRWRFSRGIIQQWFRKAAIPKHHTILRASNDVYLQSLLDAPQDFYVNLRRLAAADILRVTHGLEITENNDHFISLADEAMHITSIAGAPGAYAVSWFPFLKHIPEWFPGAGFKRQARQWRKFTESVIDEPFERWRQDSMRGKAHVSMVSDMLERKGSTLETTQLVKEVGAVAYLAGSDTTVAVIHAFILSMVLNANVQRKAQAEIDRVVGSQRLPDFDDQTSLPYIEAVIRETLRLYSVLPQGMPHRAMIDSTYQGMHIPRGTTVLQNVWSILRDPDTFADAENFEPERHLLADGSLNSDAPDPTELVFGFGRRICPGRYFAKATVYLAVSTMLACFDFTPELDDNGQPCPPEVDMISGILSCAESPAETALTSLSSLKPFACRITPRSNIAAILVRDNLQPSS